MRTIDTHVHSDLLFKLGEQLSRAETPPVIDVIRLGRITALQKPNGGVRGIVVGDIFRRLVARTIAQQMSDVVEAATAPCQQALSTRAGTECIAHILQTLTEDNPYTTVLSIDGIGAFNLISLKSMLEALMTVEGGPYIMPFVRQFCGNLSCVSGRVTTAPCTTLNRTKGAQGALLFALGQHASLCTIDERLAEGVDGVS